MPLVKGGKIATDRVRPCGRRRRNSRAKAPILVSAARFLGDAEALFAAAPGETGVIWPNNRDLDDLVPYLDRLAVGRAGVSDLPRRPRLQPGAAAAGAPRLSRASCAPPARCCATSSCSCCAPASMPSRSRRKPTRKRLPPRSSAIRCSTSRPAMAASPRCTGACNCAIRRVPANERARASGRAGADGARHCRRREELDRALRSASPAEVIADRAADRRPRAPRAWSRRSAPNRPRCSR